LQTVFFSSRSFQFPEAFPSKVQVMLARALAFLLKRM